MNHREFEVIIVGSGHAGAQVAIALRHQGFSGSIAMIGKDPEPPYERPPLSKEYLAGEKPFERILIRPAQFWGDRNVELILGTSVDSIDAGCQTVSLNTGDTLKYGKLVWAAGGSPRRLNCPGNDLGSVHSIRDRADVDKLMSELASGATRAVIVGGGYIGLEAAAVLTKLGCSVTLLEALPRVLARVAGEPLSRFYEAEHRAHGVDVRLSADVVEIEGDRSVTGVRLGSGELLACDLVIVGIGIDPAIGPLRDAGARHSNGVEVDVFGRTSLPDIYAIGDCAAHSNDFAGGATIRLESVQNANDMAVTVARGICGDPQPYHAVPWFWSNQYDLKLQTVGLSLGHNQAVLRGKMENRSFSIIYLQDGRVCALDCVNCVKDYVQGKKLVETRIRASPERLADTDQPLKELVL